MRISVGKESILKMLSSEKLISSKSVPQKIIPVHSPEEIGNSKTTPGKAHPQDLIFYKTNLIENCAKIIPYLPH